MKDVLRYRFDAIMDWIYDTGADLLIGIFLFAFFYFIGNVVRKTFQRRALRNPDRGVVLGFLGNVVMTMFVLFGLFLFMNEMGWNRLMTGLLAGAGFISIIIGLAFKDIGENFLAGILLAFSRPFNIGDLIEVDGTTGRVLRLNLRNTHLRTGEGRDVFLPNSMLVNRILINYTRDGLMRQHFVIGIDNDEDMSNAIQVAMATLQGLGQIQQEGKVKPFILVDSFGESSIQLKIFFWTNLREIETTAALIKSRVMRKVYEAYQKEGISMPGNIVEIKNYQPIQKPNAENGKLNE